jgi:hypothetical protein
VSRPPDDAPIKGTALVTGEITVYFENRRLLGQLRNSHENMILRRVRPMMPKRLFQRVRGRMRAARRRA